MAIFFDQLRRLSFLLCLAAFGFPAIGQVGDYKGNPAVISRGYTFVLTAPNDPIDKRITKSESIELYFKSLEKNKAAEILTIQLPAPANGMPQIVSRKFAVNCDAGSARFSEMTFYDGQWKMDGKPREMLGSKWEIPAQNSFAYFAYGLSCAKQ